ncbi:hypothetical protein F5879DRAFT_988603 [Lentinula edodes]|nr:hypothetical protein F5879DRAFT_988603 [Lentinula edodes]
MSTPATLDCCKYYPPRQQEKRQQVERLIQININAQVIEYLKTLTFRVIDAASTRLLTRSLSVEIFFKSFISRVIGRGKISMATTMLAITADTPGCFHDQHKGKHLSYESYSYSHQTVSQFSANIPISNEEWANIAEVFQLADIDVIEKQFLLLIQWNLSFSEEDIIASAMDIITQYPEIIL